VVRTPQILVVDGDDEQRTALAAVLDAHGCPSIEAQTVDQALSMLDHEPAIGVVVLCAAASADADRAATDRLTSDRPETKVIVCADRPPLPGAIAVSPSDERGLLAAVGTCLDEPVISVVSAADVVAGRRDEIIRRWAELCLWDPSQPPDAEPAIPERLLDAVIEALHHPQPVGWGLDPALDDVVDVFAERVATPDQAIAQLSCLRRALHEVVVRDLPLAERHEALERVSGVLDHTMMTGASLRTSRLRHEALTDALTGLGNRRAFDRDLERDIARARRASTPLTLAIIDLDGLKQINDREGHAAGDQAIAAIGRALRATSRRADRAYRIGGDEFAVILSDAVLAEPDQLVTRLQEAGAPACSVGIASAPPERLEELFEQADRALYRNRAEARRRGEGPIELG
jgi:diguanylate cyclase (GGDEF)-like protein